MIETILASLAPSGAFGILFAVRSGVPSDLIGTTLIVSTVASALTLAAATVLSASTFG